jgi:hypothetical protein
LLGVVSFVSEYYFSPEPSPVVWPNETGMFAQVSKFVVHAPKHQPPIGLKHDMAIVPDIGSTAHFPAVLESGKLRLKSGIGLGFLDPPSLFYVLIISLRPGQRLLLVLL